MLFTVVKYMKKTNTREIDYIQDVEEGDARERQLSYTEVKYPATKFP